MRTLQLTILLLLLLSGFQVSSKQIELSFQHLTIDDGLLNSTVFSIIQDSDGYIWFATRDGLCKYDGSGFRAYRYDPDDSASLSANLLYNLYVDRDDVLWVLTWDKGICAYNPDTDSFTRYMHDPDDSASISSNFVRSLYEDSKGNLWVASVTGLDIFDKKSQTFRNVFRGDLGFSSIIETENNQYLLGHSAEGISLFDYSSLKITNLLSDQTGKKNGEGGIEQHFYKEKYFYKDRNGIIWITTKGSGLYKYDPDKNKFEQFICNNNKNGSLGGKTNVIWDVTEDKKGNLWVSVDGGGLNLYNHDENNFDVCLHNPKDPESLSNNQLYRMFVDNTGILWIGTFTGGVNYYDKKNRKFAAYTHDPDKPHSLSNKSVLGFCEDDSGNIWIGTDGGGLNMFNPDKYGDYFKHYKYNPDNPKGIGSNIIKSLALDHQGNIWLGTYAGGVDKFDRDANVFHHFTESPDGTLSPEFLSCSHVWAIKEDRDHNIWLATLSKGLDIYYPEARLFRHLGANPDGTSVSNLELMTIFEDSKGNFWIGSSGGGVSIYNFGEKKFTYIQHDADNPKSLSSNDVKTIFEDSKGNMWIGTFGSGLNKMVDSATFEHYTTKDGLPDNGILGILEDDHGNLWISTNRGLSKFNPADTTFKNYTKQDGLQSNEFTYTSCLKDKKGRMYFGGINGFNFFHPDSIKDNDFIPPVFITDFKIFNNAVEIKKGGILEKHISKTKNLVLSYKHSVINFQFTALNYTLPEKNKFAYQMEGFNENWIFCGSKREATYTNLDHGEYTFRVIASNNDGVWNKEGAYVNITITPPWWKTFWFRISLFVFILGSALGFYFWRVSVLKRQKAILEHRVKERTSDLMEANATLEEQKEEIQQQNDEIISVNEQLKSRNEEILSINTQIESQKQEIETAYKNTKILSDFGQKLTSTLDFDKINNMIYNYVSSLMDTSAFGIGIYNSKRNIIDFPYFMENGNPIPYFYKEVNNDKSLSAKCFNNKEEIVLNELSDEYKQYLSGLPEVDEIRVPESVMHLPLTVESRAIGVITVNSYQKNAYSEQDRMNLRTLAAYISIALENSRSYRTVRSQNEQINGSIRYAKTIQQAVLPAKAHLDKYYDNAIVFRPKDIVSGDFYWFTTINNGHHVETHGRASLRDGDRASLHGDRRASLLAVVDCTGHGVPGAFMSLIGNMALNDIINMRHIHEPSQILEELDQLIIKMLRQEKTDNHDGMDIALIKIEQNADDSSNQSSDEKQKTNVFFSGAKRPLYWYKAAEQKTEVTEGTRRSIGGVLTSANKKLSFQTVKLEVRPGDCLYLSSDGLADQCNNRKKKFSGKRLLKILGGNATLPMNQQKEILEKHLDEFQGDFPQRDDITLWGLKF